VALAERLIGKGMTLSIYDPEVHLARLLGANRAYIDAHLPHLGALLKPGIDEVIAESDVLVLGLAERSIFDAVARLARPDQLVLDLVRLPQDHAVGARVEGLSW
jgi:GDP-mannose 6-dehydrogenase